MTDNQSAQSKLSALYAKKREAGLTSVKFAFRGLDEASFEGAATEVLRLDEAVERGDYRALRFNDKHPA